MNRAVISRLSVFCFFSLFAIQAHSEPSNFSANCSRLMAALTHIDADARLVEKMRRLDEGPHNYVLKGDEAPWAMNYYPMKKGGLVQRWQDTGSEPARLLNRDANNKVLTKKKVLEKLQGMSQSEIDKLSPAEKMDIYLGNYQFNISSWELSHRGPLRRPAPQTWEGFCNGARAAGICLPEPKEAVKVTNRDGIEITFEPADIKGLASASYFYVEKYAMIGAPNFRTNARRVDLPDAGAFDIALRAYVGTQKRGFVIDSHAGTEIWNETLFGYKRTLSNPKKFTGTQPREAVAPVAKEVEVTTEVKLLGEINMRTSNRPTQRDVGQGRLHKTDVYSYKLYLDADDKIVGGTWEGNSFPDMAWFTAGRGTDADHGGNIYLDFDAVFDLAERSAGVR